MIQKNLYRSPSRRLFEKVVFLLAASNYVLLLLAISFHWVSLPKDILSRFVIFTGVPFILISLYFGSYKEMVPRRLGDCLQAIIWILLIAAGNTYWGGPLRIDGPLFFGHVLLIPLFILLMDPFLLYFTAGVIALFIIFETFLSVGEISFLVMFSGALRIIALFIIALVCSVLVKRTITEQEAREKLHVAYEELKKLDRAKSEFISIASHQLRTPLAAIKGYISMIFEKIYGKPPEKMEKPLENIYTSNERLIKLVNDILNISRIEAGRMEIKFERLSLEEIITNVIEELKNAAKKKNIYLKWGKPERPLPKILIDRDKIRQVILNVVDNAIRYTEKGGVTIKLKTQNSKLKIVVSDTGVGMTKYELSKMFESFSRGAAGTRLYTEGVGLGLYIARRFVEMHNGKIWAESGGKGKGSTFFIELPIK